MSELRTEETKTELNGVSLDTKNEGGKSINITFKFDDFLKNIGEIFDNEFQFVAAFVNEYKGKKIAEYYTEKKRKNGTVYKSARLPIAIKKNILTKLNTLVNYDFERLTTKDVRYVVNSINEAAVDMEKAKQAA